MNQVYPTRCQVCGQPTNECICPDWHEPVDQERPKNPGEPSIESYEGRILKLTEERDRAVRSLSEAREKLNELRGPQPQVMKCGHPVQCLIDDQCGKPEHRMCDWCRDVDDCTAANAVMQREMARAEKAEAELKEEVGIRQNIVAAHREEIDRLVTERDRQGSRAEKAERERDLARIPIAALEQELAAIDAVLPGNDKGFERRHVKIETLKREHDELKARDVSLGQLLFLALQGPERLDAREKAAAKALLSDRPPSCLDVHIGVWRDRTEVAEKRVAELERAFHRVRVPACRETGCGKDATFHLTWSDRDGHCCDEHLAVSLYYVAGDHHYDRTSMNVYAEAGDHVILDKLCEVARNWMNTHFPEWRNKTINMEEAQRAGFIDTLEVARIAAGRGGK